MYYFAIGFGYGNMMAMKHDGMANIFFLMFLLVVTLPVCHIWECTSLTWPLLRKGPPTTQRTTWSIFPRWEW